MHKPDNVNEVNDNMQQYTVLKIAQRFVNTERIPLSNELCETIAKFNGYMTADEVRETLISGRSVYTNFSYYKLETLC